MKSFIEDCSNCNGSGEVVVYQARPVRQNSKDLEKLASLFGAEIPQEEEHEPESIQKKRCDNCNGSGRIRVFEYRYDGDWTYHHSEPA